jgi:hypothetical protein
VVCSYFFSATTNNQPQTTNHQPQTTNHQQQTKILLSSPS